MRHPRSPLGNLTYLAKEEMDAILVQLHLSQIVASIGPLEDELCTPRACLTQCINSYLIIVMNIYIYILYIYIYINNMYLNQGTYNLGS